MKSMVAFWTATLALFGGLLLWRNTRMYRQHSISWLCGKSIIELAVIMLTAMCLPALLIVWLVLWTTKPIKTPWIRTVMGVCSGLVFGVLANIAVEVLMICGVFAIDLKTGSSDGGFLGCWHRAKQQDTSSSRSTIR